MVRKDHGSPVYIWNLVKDDDIVLEILVISRNLELIEIQCQSIPIFQTSVNKLLLDVFGSIGVQESLHLINDSTLEPESGSWATDFLTRIP